LAAEQDGDDGDRVRMSERRAKKTHVAP
jgi:hypothetical protein